jgi:nitroreductase
MTLKKIIKQIFGANNISFVINFKDLLLNYIIDFQLYYKYSNVFKVDNFNKKEAKIILYYHSVEKGLLYEKIRPRFAQERIKNLHVFLNDRTVIKKSNLSQIRVAYQVMCEYYEFHLKIDVKIDDYFNQEQYDSYKNILLNKYDKSFSGAIEYKKDDFYKHNQSNFYDFSSSRKSIRDFTGEIIDAAIIEKAISLALNSPSVCNRQSSKVYLLQDKVKIDKILSIQNGFTGHTENVKQLLIVSSDRNYFFSIGERNQLYIDGGIFLMNLLYCLHFYKIANCPANWGKTYKDETKLANVIDIPTSEKIICMIPIGIANEDFKITLSQRRDLSEVYKYKNI